MRRRTAVRVVRRRWESRGTRLPRGLVRRRRVLRRGPAKQLPKPGRLSLKNLINDTAALRPGRHRSWPVEELGWRGRQRQTAMKGRRRKSGRSTYLMRTGFQDRNPANPWRSKPRLRQASGLQAESNAKTMTTTDIAIMVNRTRSTPKRWSDCSTTPHDVSNRPM